MKIVKRKVIFFLDAWTIPSVEVEPCVSAYQIHTGNTWVPDLSEGCLRSIVEIELSVPVRNEETELPPATALEHLITTLLANPHPPTTPMSNTTKTTPKISTSVRCQLIEAFCSLEDNFCF
jgi:hypothetical protein